MQQKSAEESTDKGDNDTKSQNTTTKNKTETKNETDSKNATQPTPKSLRKKDKDSAKTLVASLVLILLALL